MILTMTESIERLLTLQERDQRIRALQAELTRIPQERKQKERQLADSAERLAKAKARQSEIEVEKKTLEIEADSKRSAIERYKTQQLQTRKNEEYTALQHEIDAAKKEILLVEDKEIELMEEAESLTPAISTAEKEHAEEKTRITKALTSLDERVTNVNNQLQDSLDGRKQGCDGLDEDLLERYERLFESKTGGAVVPLENDVCTGCHMSVTSQTALEVRGERGIVHCPNCGRMLYLPA